MPKNINPIKKAKVKQALKLNPSARNALREAGASKYVINHSTSDKCVKVCIEELKREFSENDITIRFVINNLMEDRNLALNKGDYSTVVRVDELLGKYLAMFTDKQIDKVTFTSEEQHPEAVKERLNSLGLN